ncbi:MAG: hypothetical protein SGPRY_004941 [Prymnesium sp.]
MATSISIDKPSHANKALLLGMSGGFAGAVSKTCIAPLERVRLLAQTGESSLGMVQTMKTIVTNEGMRGLWRGNTVNVVRMVPSKCVLLSCSDLYQDLFRYNGVGAFQRGGLAGAFSGATACLCTYPLDLVRTRMAGYMLSPGSSARYESIIGTMVLIVREEGFHALFRGITPTLVGSFPYEGLKFGQEGWRAMYRGLGLTVFRGVPNTGIQFGMYELCKDVLIRFDFLRM